MTQWQDPSVLGFCAFVYNQIAVFLLGFLSNHVITNLDIEWSLITRRRRFSPALVPYLLGRYSILVVLIAFIVLNHVRSKVECDATYKALALLGSLGSFCSTLNLNIRTYIIWKGVNRCVVSVLALATVGHAALVIVQSAQSVSFSWNEQTHSCAMVHSSNITMFVFYLYTIVMDLTILVLTFCGLWRIAALKSAIGSLLSEQCLWYCIGTFLCNIPAVILPILNLNAVMNVMASMPATTLSVVMSSNAVLSLRPEEMNATTGACAPHQDPPALPTGLAVGVGGIMTSTQCALTTQIALESCTDTSNVDSEVSFSARSRKSTEGTAAGVA
ncbi:hypothetical protein BD311DRAFT_306675 [Dichomitus squalens]|uniref:G-protein coupled receptors family 1 profile domain-containing protein n=1 Tax=Dichomitus squalens TaxID=114155 RepID=A0A4Q9MN75_9APHY|nr:hypothetical protein BD311DRAFT_306675 [Dichomitus squalens]